MQDAIAKGARTYETWRISPPDRHEVCQEMCSSCMATVARPATGRVFDVRLGDSLLLSRCRCMTLR